MENGNRIDNPFYVRLKNRQEKEESDYSQTGAMNEGSISDSDFSFVGNLPVVSDEGELLSPSSSFPPVSVSPQPAA